MKNTLSFLFIRAKDILRKEGLIAFLRRGFAFLVQYRTFYLYERTIKERNEVDFMPRIQDFTFKIVSTNQQADELAANGFDLPLDITNARYRLEKGAIAFCIFVEGELAHIGWVAMTDEAKKTIDPHPYQVDFSKKEACMGGAENIPKYRGKGLMTYGEYKRDEFLRERGVETCRNAVEVGNVASQRVHAKFSPRIYAKARYLSVLGWKFWKETPLV